MGRLRLAYGLACGLAWASIQAGPAEIGGLQQELAACEADIAATQEAMRNSLGQHGRDAGDLGIRLRTLKLDQARIKRDLKAQMTEQQERDQREGFMPTVRATTPGQASTLQQRATETPVPAPAL